MSASGSENKPLLEYPTLYTFKALGLAGPLLRARVVAHVEKVLSLVVDPAQVQVRPSTGGKYESVSVQASLRSEDERRRVYEAFHADKELSWYV